MQISKAAEICVTSDIFTTGTVLTKTAHNALEDWRRVKIFKKGVNGNHLKTMTFSQLASTHQILKEKSKRPESMLEYLPENAQTYFKAL